MKHSMFYGSNNNKETKTMTVENELSCQVFIKGTIHLYIYDVHAKVGGGPLNLPRVCEFCF